MTQQQTTAALQAACLAATLVTAFAAAPAHAFSTVGPDFTTTGTNTPVYDATYAYFSDNSSTVTTSKYNTFSSYPPNFLLPNGAGIIVFTQNVGHIATYQTEDFSAAFPNVNENAVLAFLSGASTNASAYTAFYNDLYNSDPLNPALAAATTGILFSQGKLAGLYPNTTFANAPSGQFALFGVSPEPTPEPGVLTALSLGALGLSALRLRARRRA